MASHSGPSIADRLDEAAPQLRLDTGRGARGHGLARPQQHRAQHDDDRARAPSVAESSGHGIPSIAPTIARVSSQANAMMTAVCPAAMAAIARKNQREALACLSRRGSTGGVRFDAGADRLTLRGSTHGSRR